MSLFSEKNIPEWFRKLFVDLIAEYPETKINYRERIGKYWHALRFFSEYIIKRTFQQAIESNDRFPPASVLVVLASSTKHNLPITPDKDKMPTKFQHECNAMFLRGLAVYVGLRKGHSLKNLKANVNLGLTDPHPGLSEEAKDKIEMDFIEWREKLRLVYRAGSYKNEPVEFIDWKEGGS